MRFRLAPKTYAKGTKLGGSAKNKEQREGVRRAKETPAINPTHFTERPQSAPLPWGASCHMRTNDN